MTVSAGNASGANDFAMTEEISFSDWPGQPVDLTGSNPWLPAYGFQHPHALLDKSDFLGNPDAEFFFQGSVGSQYMYLETIQEETSDDLRSESDLSEGRFSSGGWLATDSEAGSVIRITLDDADCESEREMACPAKRMRQESNLLGYSDDDSSLSLSRSSSLLQFETLERQCQDVSSSSPSVFSTFSYDSLENRRKDDVSPDSLEDEDVDAEPVSDYYKNLKVDLAMRPKRRNDSARTSSDSDSSESTDSERTLSNAFVSTGSLKITRSFDDLHKDKISAENLSEDSGYSDHLNKSSSIPNLFVALKKGGVADADQFSNTISSHFGSSFHDLSALDKYDGDFNLIERFARTKSKRSGDFAKRTDAIVLNIETECDDDRSESKYNAAAASSSSASEPNLLLEAFSALQDYSVVSSVPKDLNLAGGLTRFCIGSASVAAKNCDIADLTTFDNLQIEMASFKRERSYTEAMSNRVDLSDDEGNHRDTTRHHSTIVEFDKQILKTISESSIPSAHSSRLNVFAASTPLREHANGRNVASTPNLAAYNESENTSDEDGGKLAASKSFSGSTGSKGVHFCPVVAEVKWRDESVSSRESTCSLSDTPIPGSPSPPLIRPKPRMPAELSRSEPQLQKQTQTETQPPPPNLIEQPHYIPLKPRTIVQEGGGMQRRGSKVVHKDEEGNVLAAYVDPDGVQYKHIHLGDVYKSMPPAPTGSHVSSNTKSIKNATTQSTKRAMDAVVAPTTTTARRGSKLGGFFSRLASFRFSSRNKNADPLKTAKSVAAPAQYQHQRLATKEDYIHIPLKGPERSRGVADDDQQVSACVSAKPPLPKTTPPRVVSASVKKAYAAQEPPPPMRSEYATNIDSGDAFPRLMEPMGLIETDLDTEVTVITSGANVKTRSLMNLGAEAPKRSLEAPPHPDRPHKSMEFLLDKQNLKVVEPPENELQKGERVMSEHQLRIQRSLQKLTIPDWYKQSLVPREGFLLKKNTAAARERWTGTASKTPSLSSLGSNNQYPIMLSPSPHNLQPFVRWSTSKLNSTASSPCASTRSSFNARQPNGSISPSSVRSSFSYRQPYLGWRSQERLTRPRTPAERLACSFLAQTQNQQMQPPESPEIHTSIKEVTSAIVHYVSGLTPEISDARSVSPRGSQKLCWMESSFVGTRPVDVPETPVSLPENHRNSTPTPPISSLRLELQKTHNGESIRA